MRHQTDLRGQSRSVDGAPDTISFTRMRSSSSTRIGGTLVESPDRVKTEIAIKTGKGEI
ncbi:hypothetical protein C7450_109272 [Chelatococcus asaccharovorans]|uniref:Uncharacterized protein n=1 Tax=Chelatococcus asaccharovorans TaxID=28210 RepID=A0A2V3U197_9HYPH|nr:hypothetical protein C7450_109272 [Chelatococcus asaccharovorans]